MNQLTHKAFAGAVKGFIPESPFEEKAHLADAIARYDNDCGYHREKAVDAIASRRAAFWSTAHYSDQRCRGLLYPLNAEGKSVSEAIAECFPDYVRDGRIDGLDSLVPLNRKAAVALANAYDQVGSWREIEELEARRDRRAA